MTCKADKNQIRVECQGADRLPLDAIEEFQGNLKRRTKKDIDRIITSIDKYGFSFPFFVWNGDGHNRCLDGHGRLQALAEMRRRGCELPTFPVAYVEAADEAEAKQKLLRLNSAYGEMTVDSVVEFADGLEMQWDELALPGGTLSLDMTPDRLVEDAEPKITIADELAEKWGCKRGQVWSLGDNRIMCGDSADQNDMQKLMAGDKASIVVTDPPYGVSIGKKNEFLNSFQKAERNLTEIEDDALSPDELKRRLLPGFANIRSSIAEDCTVFVTAPQGGGLGMMMMMMMMMEAGLPIRHVLMWKKNSPTFSMGRLDYDYQHEPILLTWGQRHKRPMKGRHRTSVWEIDKPRSSHEHPTMKPVELYENALLNNSDSGDIALDAYCGSGTMIAACEMTGRKARAMEISPGYVGVSIQRWVDMTGGSPALIEATA